MKKSILLSTFLLVMPLQNATKCFGSSTCETNPAYANNQLQRISFSTCIFNNHRNKKHIGNRIPARAPEVFLDGHTLLLSGDMASPVHFQLMYVDEIILEGTLIPGKSGYTIPDDLTGMYDLHLDCNGYCYMGGIYL